MVIFRSYGSLPESNPTFFFCLPETKGLSPEPHARSWGGTGQKCH